MGRFFVIAICMALPVLFYTFVTFKLRKEYNWVFLLCSFEKAQIFDRKFSVFNSEGAEQLKRSVLIDLDNGKWPTSCIIKRRKIADYVRNVQTQVLVCRKEQQLNFIASRVFDIRNRIFAIDNILSKVVNNSCNAIIFKNYKFVLLNKTKLSKLSNLSTCKIVMFEVLKANGIKKVFGMNRPIDKVLQFMFFTFLDVLVDKNLKPAIFAYRKGRDRRMAVAGVYSRLNWARCLNQICLCSADFEKCFDNILHKQILKQYPFPKKYSFLFLRWLTPNIINKSQDYERLGKVSRGVFRDSIFGPSIVNLLLSNALPYDIYKEKTKGKKEVWLFFFSCLDHTLLIANSFSVFRSHLSQWSKAFSKIGLFFNSSKTKAFNKIKKVKFEFLGFEFIVVLKKQLKKDSLLSNAVKSCCLKKNVKMFKIILKPSSEKVSEIKQRLKKILQKVLPQSRNEMYKYFPKISSVLLNWWSYYYFCQGCAYGKKIDYYVFKLLKQTLVKKFRYNGLFRPKWVSYEFLGLGKVNLNGRKWQPQVLQYSKNLFKASKQVYVWNSTGVFFKLSISSFFLHSAIRFKSYYSSRKAFKKCFVKLISKRLKSDIKVKLYIEQSGSCLVCKEQITEIELLNRASCLHVHHLVSHGLFIETGWPNKFYRCRKNKVLLHDRCHLILHKSKILQSSFSLWRSVPQKSVFF